MACSASRSASPVNKNDVSPYSTFNTIDVSFTSLPAFKPRIDTVALPNEYVSPTDGMVIPFPF